MRTPLVAVRRPLVGAAALLLAATALAACSSDPDPAQVGEKADGTAAALVAGLTSGELGDLPYVASPRNLSDGAKITKDFADVVDGMAGRDYTVALGDVSESGDTATADLDWSWALVDPGDWTYTSTVDLARTDGEWQVAWDHSIVEPSLNANSVLDTTTFTGSRGDIIGADGIKLVTNRPVVKVGIDRTQVKAAAAGDSATQLARLVDIDAAGYRAQVEAAGDKAFVEAITYRQDDLPPAVADGYEAIDGAELIGTEIPLAPTREFAAPILGTVGPVTAEMVKDDPERYQAGDTAGLSGLQARYDEQLQGTSGAVVSSIGSDGKEREIFRTDAGDGTPLKLTLDEDLQTQAESLLSGVGPASALVAIRPSDGAILAAANGPGNNGQNLATFGQYAPGSTFKSVSSLALVRRGLKPDSTVDCSSSITVDGKVFENYDDYPSSALGRIPFRTALANSCNTAFIAERTLLKGSDLADAAASLGMGVDHDLGFPAFFGSVDPPTTETGAAADMIGQGTVLASPMTMATVIASIQAGKLVVPRLIESVDVSPPDGVTGVSKSEATTLRALLRGVVTDGSGRGLLDVPGPEIIAKTGTAEFTDADGNLSTHAWMIAAQGDLAVAVFVDVGSSGSGTAGPILEQFLRDAQSG